jgi:hypothetical protein
MLGVPLPGDVGAMASLIAPHPDALRPPERFLPLPILLA